MYYLAKFCRICIQMGVDLVDIESTDYDSVTFSEKLKVCTQMVITRESLSTKICPSCICKLRVSYQFHSMCKKSTTILEQYLTELLSASEEIGPDKFILSEIQVNVPSKGSKPRRKRVGKEQRCSLLRKILSKVTHTQFLHNMHINGLTRLCDRIPVPQATVTHSTTPIKIINKKQKKLRPGGLRNLLDFTKDFDFGYDINLATNNFKYVDLTPLEQLAKFTENFFCDHFLDYRETIVNIGDTLELDDSEEESMFDEWKDEEPSTVFKEEIVIVESNLNIKTEFFDEGTNDYEYSSSYAQACYDNNNEVIKQEMCEVRDEVCEGAASYSEPRLQQPEYFQFDRSLNLSEGSYKKQRTISPYSAKCRTRGNPFINPQLKKQFQTRNFKCGVCNRRFKGPGYLKAHCSRFKH